MPTKFNLFATCALALCMSYAIVPAHAVEQRMEGRVSISAFIGADRFTLTGYTSPYAKVIFDGQGIYEETTANDKGLFIFDSVFSPLSPREACLTAVDIQGRITRPVCLPPFPVHKHVRIGPIILPPSISLSAESLTDEGFATLTGKATPFGHVVINVSPEKAEKALVVETSADHSGTYSLSLPNQRYDNYYTSATVKAHSLQSEPSIPLSYEVKTWFWALLEYLRTYLLLLRPYAISLVLMAEFLAILYLLTRHKKALESHPLALRPDHTLLTSAEGIQRQ